MLTGEAWQLHHPGTQRSVTSSLRAQSSDGNSGSFQRADSFVLVHSIELALPGSRKSRLYWGNENERIGSLKRAVIPITIATSGSWRNVFPRGAYFLLLRLVHERHIASSVVLETSLVGEIVVLRLASSNTLLPVTAVHFCSSFIMTRPSKLRQKRKDSLLTKE